MSPTFVARATRSRERAGVRGLWLCLSLLLSLQTASVRADGRSFQTNARLEAPLVAAGASAWIILEVMKAKLTPAHCRWCSVDTLDTKVRDALRWNSPGPARHASDAMLFGLMPLAAFGSAILMANASRVHDALPTDMLMLVESLVLTADLTQLTKYSAARERPYAHAARVDHGIGERRADDVLSFFSGHTSSVFALASAVGTTASLRGYKQAPLVWAIGMPLAAFTGYLRLAGDKHYFTDVLMGALVGTAIGALIPWLHTLESTHKGSMPALLVSPPGTISFSWVN